MDHLASEEEFSLATTVRYTNAEDLTEAQCIQRKFEMNEMIRRYPNVPAQWIELVWNYCARTPMKDQEQLVQKIKAEKKSPVKTKF